MGNSTLANATHVQSHEYKFNRVAVYGDGRRIKYVVKHGIQNPGLDDTILLENVREFITGYEDACWKQG